VIKNKNLSYRRDRDRRDRAMIRLIEYFAKSLKVIGYDTILKLGYGFLFAFRYGSILYHFGNKARYWSKIAIFHTLMHRRPY